MNVFKKISMVLLGSFIIGIIITLCYMPFTIANEKGQGEYITKLVELNTKLKAQNKELKAELKIAEYMLGDKGTYPRLIISACNRWRVDPFLMTAIIKKESNFNPNARSYANAQGLCQIMPLHGIKNVFNPKININAGTRILAGYIERHGLYGGLAKYSGHTPCYADHVLKIQKDIIKE